EKGAWLEHSDQYRGLKYAYLENPGGPGATAYAEPSPDYFMYQDLGGPGLVPWGYGVRSVDALVSEIQRIERETNTLEERRRTLAEIDARGVLATPANSRFNELVCQAGRRSILDGGRPVRIEYDPPVVG